MLTSSLGLDRAWPLGRGRSHREALEGLGSLPAGTDTPSLCHRASDQPPLLSGVKQGCGRATTQKHLTTDQEEDGQ